MSSTAEPWGPWADAMRAAQIGDPRNGRPSWTQLAHKAGVSTSTVTKVVTGQRKAEAPTIHALARALRVKPEIVSDWLSIPIVRGPWEPPSEAALLADHEREAISGLIRAIVRGREEAHDGHRPPTTPAGDSPAQDVIKSSHSKVLDEESEPGPEGSGQQPGRGKRSRRPS